MCHVVWRGEDDVATGGGVTRHQLRRHNRPRPPPRIEPALPRRTPSCSCVDRLLFFVNGSSTSRLLCAKPAALTQIDENEHDGPQVCSESQVVITTNTCPTDSRALGVRWVAWFGFPCYGPGLSVGRTKINREVALVRSPRPACCARLLLANQTHIRLSLAVAVGRRTEIHQTTPRL